MRTPITAVVALALFAGPALAHETWILPSRFSAALGEELRFDVGSGMDFPKFESPIKADRVALARYRLGVDEAEIPRGGEGALVLRQAFPRAGLATIWLDLQPRKIEMPDDKVEEYLDEIGASAKVRSIWAGQKGQVPWKETYTKHAKTFVGVGAALPGATADTLVGSALELAPAASTFPALAGQEFSVKLRADSRPLPDQAVGLLIEGSSERVFKTTDGDGRATFSLPRKGRAMAFAVRLHLAPDGTSWVSDFCTMTFEIID